VSRRKKRWSEYSPVQKLGLGAVTALSLGLVAAAERDVQRRSTDEIRGSRLVWRMLCLNALGAIGYYLLGRRPAT
jgi:hypothetical protein